MESDRSQDPAPSTSTHCRGNQTGSHPRCKCIRSPPTSALAELSSNGKHSQARHREFVLQVFRRCTTSCTCGSCWCEGRTHRNRPRSRLWHALKASLSESLERRFCGAVWQCMLSGSRLRAGRCLRCLEDGGLEHVSDTVEKVDVFKLDAYQEYMHSWGSLA